MDLEEESTNENCQLSSDLNVSVEKIVQVFKNHEEEAIKLDKRKHSLEIEVKEKKKSLMQLELKKCELEAEITSLKLRNVAYQKEHTNLRNSIKMIKFQIEKIKEGIEKAKANELRDLEDFEKAVDEITEKFRASPAIYDRKIVLENIEREREKKFHIIKKMEELKNSYEEFNREKGLRVRQNGSEDFLDCILPDSELYCLIEMTKNLDEVISGIKKSCSSVNLDGKELQDLDRAVELTKSSFQDVPM